MNHGAAVRTGPFWVFAELLSAVHSLSSAKTTCCMRSSLEATSCRWSFSDIPSGNGPGLCCASGGAPYDSVLTTALTNESWAEKDWRLKCVPEKLLKAWGLRDWGIPDD